MRALSIIINGNVHGVFFRRTAKEHADALKIRGWVRNNPDGSVEIHAEGDNEALQEFEKWAHRGPPAAKVEHVRIESVTEEGCVSFEVIGK